MSTTTRSSEKPPEISGSFYHLIDGQLESSAAAFAVINPATAEPFAECPDAYREQLDRAVAAARRAFRSWRDTSFAERRAVLHRFADALQQHRDDLAPLLTREQGKPLADARAEIQRAADSVREICSIVIEPELLRQDAKGRVELHYRPLGVVGGITPWNVPIVVDEEPFGPILPILSFRDVSDVIERANHTRFGLGGSVWTKDVARGEKIAGQLEAGVVWVNHHVGLARDFPFGGMKESGLGRQGHAIGVKGDMEPQVVVLPPV
jgi:acyl-CoA reductase-like NAD-dependent aldehyde dehydrogenase